MKKFILVSGVLFYFFSATITVLTTFLFSEAGKPDHAFVRNVQTGERVWQPSYEAIDVYPATRFAAISNPAHNTDARAGGKDSPDYLSQVTYGEYYSALFDGKAPSISKGSAAYTEAVCWHCHSQFVRPLAYENYRWGPTSQIGEGAHDAPTRFGTRRVGPDLAREGGARTDDWHYAHFDNPKFTVPQSIMAPYGGISRYWKQESQAHLDELQAKVTERVANQQNSESRNEETRQTEDFKTAREVMEGFQAEGDDVWVMWKGRTGGSRGGSPVLRVAKKPNERIRNLTTYVQTRGIGIGITSVTDDYFGGGKKTQKADDAGWQNYIRKLDFSPGIWRMQLPGARPSSRPSYVLAPAEFIAKRPNGYESGTERSTEDYRFMALKNQHELSLRRGVNLFMLKCAGCHGGLDQDASPLEFSLDDRKTLERIGNGYGPAAPYLTPEPRNFHLAAKSPYPLIATDTGDLYDTKAAPLMPREMGSEVGRFKNRSGRPEFPLAKPEDLFHTIRNGMAPSSMPAWPFLIEWEIWDLVNFVMFLGDAQPRIDQEFDRQVAAAGKQADKLTAEERESFRKLAREAFESSPNGFSYFNPKTVDELRASGPVMPQLMNKPEVAPEQYQAELDKLKNVTTPAERERRAALYWAIQFRGLAGYEFKLDGKPWSQHEMHAIGHTIFLGGVYDKRDGKEVELKKVGKVSNLLDIPACSACHGRESDSWGLRRGEMISVLGFPARNYYLGQFKMGASHAEIWRTMRYGIEGTPMINQIDDSWSALEAFALAEHVLNKRDQGVYGIGDSHDEHNHDEHAGHNH